jgi:hypothetical protein
VRLNNEFQEIDRHPIEGANMHGVTIDEANGHIYVNETIRNRIGVYTIDGLKPGRSLLVAPSDDKEDWNHVNSVVFKDGKLLVSMFSFNGVWQDGIWTDGAIAELNAETGKVERVFMEQLMQPHSVMVSDGRIYFCNSMDCNVYDRDRVICQMNGYLRGLARVGDHFFIGQSEMRRLGRFSGRFTNISMDCGIYIWNRTLKTSRFLHLPSEGVFDIAVL